MTHVKSKFLFIESSKLFYLIWTNTILWHKSLDGKLRISSGSSLGIKKAFRPKPQIKQTTEIKVLRIM